jgi:hypothetical protein
LKTEFKSQLCKKGNLYVYDSIWHKFRYGNTWRHSGAGIQAKWITKIKSGLEKCRKISPAPDGNRCILHKRVQKDPCRKLWIEDGGTIGKERCYYLQANKAKRRNTSAPTRSGKESNIVAGLWQGEAGEREPWGRGLRTKYWISFFFSSPQLGDPIGHIHRDATRQGKPQMQFKGWCRSTFQDKDTRERQGCGGGVGVALLKVGGTRSL